ncbi:hypothetical protein CCACVL1_22039 [Corchorus capsularis]|uniref:Uncharacterized protein n=1 Tax=Corchorus capsularis TaxID=210143 RepID=A0A1R3H167_COCAP|nr:hypothetical protein CCACVL1_22039 [Corchorus capsularis]
MAHKEPHTLLPTTSFHIPLFRDSPKKNFHAPSFLLISNQFPPKSEFA